MPQTNKQPSASLAVAGVVSREDCAGAPDRRSAQRWNAICNDRHARWESRLARALSLTIPLTPSPLTGAHRGRSRPRRHGTPRRGRYLKTLDLSRVGSKVRADHAATTRRRPLRSGDCRTTHGRDPQEDQARWRLDDLHEQLEELGFV
jgi:hypothetical protein